MQILSPVTLKWLCNFTFFSQFPCSVDRTSVHNASVPKNNSDHSFGIHVSGPAKGYQEAGTVSAIKFCHFQGKPLDPVLSVTSHVGVTLLQDQNRPELYASRKAEDI